MVLLALKNFRSSAKKECTNFGTRLKVVIIVFLALKTCNLVPKIIKSFDLVPKIIKSFDLVKKKVSN
jgi:hypothetical protein